MTMRIWVCPECYRPQERKPSQCEFCTFAPPKPIKRAWRKPTEADRADKCRARNRFEKRAFYVEWNTEYSTWSIAGRNHILVRVDEILAPIGDENATN